MPARLNAIPSPVLFGRLKGIPYQNRLCPCGQKMSDSVDHMILDCPLSNIFYFGPSISFMWLRALPNKQLVVQLLLRDDSPELTRVMAHYLNRIYEIKASTSGLSNNDC